MGIRNLFRSKELTDEDAKNILEKNGVVTRDEGQYHKSKFKFKEFAKYSEQNAKNKDNTLKPITKEDLGSGYSAGAGADSGNKYDSYRSQGYDSHAGEYQPSDAGRYGNERETSYSRARVAGGLGSGVGSRVAESSGSIPTYGRDPYDSRRAESSASIPTYGRDPYGSRKVAESSASIPTYHRDPYESSGGYDGGDDVYGLNVDETYNDDRSVADVGGLSSGMQALQMDEEQKQGQEVPAQTQVFDPYGPAAGRVQTSEQESGYLDLNAYEPTRQTNAYYDEQEFEEIDEDEEEVNRIQRQTKDVREDTVHLSRQLVDNLGNANVTATNTLGVLGNQREKIYEMENNIGTMNVQQRFVDDHVKELEHYNRGLFHVKMNNPFTRSSRKRAKDQQFLAQRHEDRAAKDKLNSNLLESQKAIMGQMQNDGGGHTGLRSELQEKYDYERRVKEASKYLTEDHDEEDEKMEVEIAANFDQAQKLANTLRQKAEMMSHEIGKQNRDLQSISQNVDTIDDKVVMTTRRIRGI